MSKRDAAIEEERARQALRELQRANKAREQDIERVRRAKEEYDRQKNK